MPGLVKAMFGAQEFDGHEKGKSIKDIIQDFFNLTVSVHDYQGPETQEILISYIKLLVAHLITLSDLAPTLSVAIPPEIIAYVENGRNPDIYTREFVELVQRGNQLMKGKADAFRSFRDVLVKEVGAEMPEFQKELELIVRNTGG
ncbi:MAG: RNA polymerase II mediator complex subunit [Trizodia sp. TS-e1964]|nr:MAG: RNA polymerase II mediator complex subunit [Trizodia sp. TS-e1964]